MPPKKTQTDADKKEKKVKRSYRLWRINGEPADKPRYYKGVAPKNAAIQAFKIWGRKQGDDANAVFTIRESQRGSAKRCFTYEGAKTLLPDDRVVKFVRKTKPKTPDEPVISKEITIRHDYDVKRLYLTSNVCQ